MDYRGTYPTELWGVNELIYGTCLEWCLACVSFNFFISVHLSSKLKILTMVYSLFLAPHIQRVHNITCICCPLHSQCSLPRLPSQFIICTLFIFSLLYDFFFLRNVFCGARTHFEIKSDMLYQLSQLVSCFKTSLHIYNRIESDQWAWHLLPWCDTVCLLFSHSPSWTPPPPRPPRLWTQLAISAFALFLFPSLQILFVL